MLLLASIALAECTGEANRTTLELTTALRQAESAYGSADVDGFLAATSEMDTMLPCMQEQVPRSMVARLHRTFGIRAFVDRQPERAAAAFRGARSLEPDYHFPPQLVPAQHPMAKLYEENSEIGPSEPVDAPATGALVFDGRRRPERPQERLSLFQRIDSDENVAETVLLWPGDPMPSYEVAVAEPVAVAPEPGPKKPERVKQPKPEKAPKEPKEPKEPKQASTKKGGPMVPLLITAAGTAALAGGVYAAAGVSRGAYENAPLEHKDALKGRTNALVFTSAGLGVAAVGVGVTAVLTGKW